MPERRDGNRVVVTGYSGGSHFPRTEADTIYEFEADGTSSDGPFRIAGSVYGRNIRFRGPGVVKGTVLGRGDITLHNHSTGTQRFLSGLSVNGNLVAEGRGAGLQDSLVGGLDNADYVFRGDVLGEGISLENAVVLGNVDGTNVTLVNCLVLGAAIAKENLTVRSSTVLCYNSINVTFEGPCTMVHAMGESATAPVEAPYQDGAGAIWDPDIRYYPAFHGRGNIGLMNQPWAEPGAAFQGAKLFLDTDWVKIQVEKRQETDGPTSASSQIRHEERYVLSISGRALNFNSLEQQIKGLYLMLSTGLEFDHYHPDTRSEVVESWESVCTAEELRFMRLVTADFEASEAG